MTVRAPRPLSIGDEAVVLTVPKLSGKQKAPWAAGDHVRVEKVSSGGLIVVSGHTGYFAPRHFDRVAR